MHLRKDQRVADFCGETIQPGWLITRDKRPGENWVKYEMTVKGTSGKLKTKVIADYLTHLDLNELEQERKEYFEKVALEAAKKLQETKSKSKATKEVAEPALKATSLDANYIPVDFDSYSIADV